MQKIDTDVGKLVSMIQGGELRLPEMQRRYVWPATRVRDLLDSLYRGYPSGAILVWETDREMPSRDLAVSQAISPFKGHKLLLDGQQRLTSLSAIVRGEPVIVRKGKKAIDILFNLDHPEGPPLELLEVDEDSDGEEGDPDVPEAEKNIQERLKQRIGIDDNGKVIGLGTDYKTLSKRQDCDGYQQFLVNLLSVALGKEACANLSISFANVESKEVAIIKVPKGTSPVYVADGHHTKFYLRTGNTTQELTTKESIEYVNSRWP